MTYDATVATPPCGHHNGTHPFHCWWVYGEQRAAEALAAAQATLDTVAAERDALADAVRDGSHGTCSCSGLTADGEGPRPIGGGRFYHYQGCDYDAELLDALAAASPAEKATPR